MIDFGFNIRLKSVSKENLEELRRWRNEPAIYNWCRQNDLISELDQAKWYEKINSDPRVRMYEIHAEGLVGVCGLTDVDLNHRRAEFSLYIGPAFQKRGFAKRALVTLFQHGFKNLGLEQIWGETFEGNPALKLFLSLGMKEDGIRRKFYYKNGEFIDAHLVSILKNDLAKTCFT